MMKILALETTEALGSVAAAVDDKIIAEITLSSQQRSAQSLAPGLQSLLAEVGWQPKDVELVAVTSGPGSFTGLRVGVATAKVFAYAVGAEVLGIDTLETIAASAPPEVTTLSVAMDAQRGDVVFVTFQRDTRGWLVPLDKEQLLPAGQWLAGLPAGTAVAGPVLKKLLPKLPSTVRALPPAQWHPTAGNVARLAWRHYSAGQRGDLWQLTPRYSRQSAAEEMWVARQAKPV